MKRICAVLLFGAMLLSLSGCDNVPEFGELAPTMWYSVEVDPIGLVLTGWPGRSGLNREPYPEVDLTKIEKMPVYKATGKAADKRADGKALAEKFGIDLSYIESAWSDTDDIYMENGEFCAGYRDAENLFSVDIVPTGDYRDFYEERYDIMALSENRLRFSAVSPRGGDDVSLKKIGIDIPDTLSSISFTLNDDSTCEISAEEEKAIASFFTEYVNSNPDIFPFKVSEYYTETKRYGLWANNDEGEMCGAAGTRVIFCNCEDVTEADILAAHHKLTDVITAAYIVGTTWQEGCETTHRVEITVEEYSESYELVGEYDIIPFENAEKRFKNNENVNYTREIPEDETDEHKSVYLKYIIDSEGYARPVYVYGISPNDSSAWIDAIER